MSGKNGSTVLDEQGRALLYERFGLRYVAVQSMPYSVSRRERRRIQFGGKTDPRDVALYEAKHELRKKLMLNPLAAEVPDVVRE